jgi:hypothetical protein
MAHKHKKKAKHGRARMRNAASAAIARMPRRPTASTAAHQGDPSKTDSRAWQVAKVLGGAAVSAVGCSFIARQEWLPPKALTAGVAAVGAALYAGGQNDTLRMVGAGAAASAGGMFTYLMIDDAVHTKPASQPQVASNPPPVKRQADGLPPGALEAAYERARRRMALADHG